MWNSDGNCSDFCMISCASFCMRRLDGNCSEFCMIFFASFCIFLAVVFKCPFALLKSDKHMLDLRKVMVWTFEWEPEFLCALQLK
jgi:hypothetical protein